jgi:hypothetical protein
MMNTSRQSKYGAIFLFILLFLISPHESPAQVYIYYQPRFMLGASTAAFRISIDNFESVYTNRWGWSHGGFAGVRVYSRYYVTVKHSIFQKHGRVGTQNQTGLDLGQAKWDERWTSVGLRIHPSITRKYNSYYGFGVAFFRAQEVAGLSIIDNETAHSIVSKSSGIYLELGLEYFPIEKVAVFFEIEVASARVRKSITGITGFEATSIGGFRFALGVSFWPF